MQISFCELLNCLSSNFLFGLNRLWIDAGFNRECVFVFVDVLEELTCQCRHVILSLSRAPTGRWIDACTWGSCRPSLRVLLNSASQSWFLCLFVVLSMIGLQLSIKPGEESGPRKCTGCDLQWEAPACWTWHSSSSIALTELECKDAVVTLALFDRHSARGLQMSSSLHLRALQHDRQTDVYSNTFFLA